MDFRTKVELPASLPPVTHAGQILLLGSCFAENMGRQLAENKFRVDVNPFGILYNPFSVSTALVEILKEGVSGGKIYLLIRSVGIARCIMAHSPQLRRARSSGI